MRGAVLARGTGAVVCAFALVALAIHVVRVTVVVRSNGYLGHDLHRMAIEQASHLLAGSVGAAAVLSAWITALAAVVFLGAWLSSRVAGADRRRSAHVVAVVAAPALVFVWFFWNRYRLPLHLSLTTGTGRSVAAAACLAGLGITWALGARAAALGRSRALRRAVVVGGAGASVAMGLIVLVGASGLARREARGPNVILVVLDTVRRSNLSTYGYERATSPHLDRIAADGVVFERAWSSSPWTGPSHASMFTGLYTLQHGTNEENKRLEPGVVTLAEILGDAGWETVAFVDNPSLNPARGFDQGFARFVEPWRPKFRARFPALEQNDKGAAVTCEAIRRWLHAREDPGRPFFLFVNFLEAHMPYGAPGEDDRRFLPPGAEVSERHRRYDYVRLLAGFRPMAREDFEIAEALYDGAIAYQDRLLGELYDWLGREGALRDTILIVTADHGEHFGEHGLVGHQFSLYEPLLHVPLVIRHPSAFSGGRRSTRRVQLVDLFPTILDATGVEPPPGLPVRARSLFREGEHETVFAEYYRPAEYLEKLRRDFPQADGSRYDQVLRSVEARDTKLIWSSRGGEELYDLPGDPGETDDLAAARPERARELRRLLFGWVEALSPAARPGGSFGREREGDEVERELRSLGYVQ